MGCNFHGDFTVDCCEIFSNPRFVANRLEMPQFGTQLVCGGGSGCVTEIVPECDPPWLDDVDPLTDKIIGLYVDEMQISNPFTRETGETRCGGYVKPFRPKVREIVFRGIGLAQGECAVEKLKEWFYKATVASGACGGQQAKWYKCCDLSQVRVAEGFIWTGLDITNETVSTCDGFEFEATAQITNPFLYGVSQDCMNAPVKEGLCPKLILCEGHCAPAPAEVLCGCHTEIPVLSETTVDDSDCFCTPFEVWRKCCTFQPSGNLNDWVLNFELKNGWTKDTGWVRVRAWSDPNMMGSDWLIGKCVPPCVDMIISCLPKGGGFVFNGATGKSVVKDRYGRGKSGRRLLSADSKINHVFGCKPITVCVEMDANNSDDDLSAHVFFTPRYVS